MARYQVRMLARFLVVLALGCWLLMDVRCGSAAPLGPDSVSGLVQWLDASALGLSNNDPVATWTDSSSNGNDATAVLTTNQPTYKASALNGQPAVQFVSAGQFDTTNSDYLNTTFSSTVAQPFTIFWVGQMNGNHPTAATDYFFDGTTSGNRVTVATNFSGTDETDFGMYAGVGFSTTFTRSQWQQWHLYTAEFNTTASDLLVDGGTLSSGNAGATSLSALRYGARYNAQHFLDGYLAEVIIYDHSLTPAELNIVGGYLEDKYGLDTTFAAVFVPEPATGLLAGWMLAGVGAFGRRRTRRSARQA